MSTSDQQHEQQLQRIARYATQIEMLSQLLEQEADQIPSGDTKTILNGHAKSLYDIARDLSYGWDMAEPRIDPPLGFTDGIWGPVPHTKITGRNYSKEEKDV